MIKKNIPPVSANKSSGIFICWQNEKGTWIEIEIEIAIVP
jgi:hypothetical protein